MRLQIKSYQKLICIAPLRCNLQANRGALWRRLVTAFTFTLCSFKQFDFDGEPLERQQIISKSRLKER